jgi:hypothetical protein
MAVAATFITVSATSAMAQQPSRSTAAELAIDAAIPRPEPANVPPPTAADFKLDTTASTTPPAPAAKPADTVTAPAPVTPDNAALAPAVPLGASPAATPAAPPAPVTAAAPSAPPASAAAAPATATAAPSAPEATPTAPAADPVKAASTVAPADQPVADRLKDQLASKTSRYFDRKAEKSAVEKFYSARDYAPLWIQGGSLTSAAKGAIARLKDAASDGLNPSDYPVPDFASATTPDALAEADLKLTHRVLDYARQAQSGRIHWSQVSADIQ